MKDKNEYLNEQIDLLAVEKWYTAGQELTALAGGCLRWKIKVVNKSWTSLKGMEKSGNNGLTDVC